MDDQLAVLKLVVTRLEAAGIPYFITGSIALAAYATPRMTRDIDVVIDCDAEQAVALASAFQGDSYADTDAARDAARTHGAFNIIHDATLVKVDFFCRSSRSSRAASGAADAQRFARRRRLDLAGFAADFSSPEDLILSKLQWRRESGSEQQLRDVRSLLTTRDDVDNVYLERMATQLNLADALAEARARD